MDPFGRASGGRIARLEDDDGSLDGTATSEGFVVGLTNPKAAVFFAAILPQFTDASLGHVPLQMLILGVVFIAIALVCDGVWGIVAGVARERLAASPRRLEAIGGAGGVVLVGLGIGLAATGRRP